jgi:CHASE2 domain-containing sensor protein
VRPLLPVLAAGGTFAAATVVGLVVGIVVAERRDQPLWALAGLMLGAGIGAYSALRLVLKALR